MTKHFPPEMIQAARAGKKSFISDPQIINPNDCQNCGGLGTFVLFIAIEGPYNSPTEPNRKDALGKPLVSHWFDDKWWIGNSREFTCPDCKGFRKGAMKQEKLMPVERNIDSAVDRMTKW